VDLATGRAQPFLQIPGETIVQARISPDGTFVYFLHSEQSGDIWMASFDTDATADR
jgi:hypothetical protein